MTWNVAVFGKVNITVRLCPSQRISLQGWFSCSRYAARYTSVVVISVMVLSFFLIQKGWPSTMQNLVLRCLFFFFVSAQVLHLPGFLRSWAFLFFGLGLWGSPFNFFDFLKYTLTSTFHRIMQYILIFSQYQY